MFGYTLNFLTQIRTYGSRLTIAFYLVISPLLTQLHRQRIARFLHYQTIYTNMMSISSYN